MSPAEIAWRVREQAIRRAWARRQVRPGQVASLPPLRGAAGGASARFTAVLPPARRRLCPSRPGTAIIADADRLLKGEWEMLGVVRTDMEQPDWFHDPVTGRRSAPEAYAFRINQRDEAAVGNIKQVWEVNRLQHLTLLATAWYLTGEDAYAERVAEQLRSWWRENPFLSGVNWTSGIELGVRLINFAWIRRLLDGWPGGRRPVRAQRPRRCGRSAGTRSTWPRSRAGGSSANNHVIAEAAGQLAASCAFPWFAESARWRRDSLALLERELAHNTFPSGINRELASDYHGFVAELGFFAAVEAAAAGVPAQRRDLAAAVRDGRRHGRARRRAGPAAAPGRLRRGARGAARRPRAQPLAGAAVARRRAVRPARLVAGGWRRTPAARWPAPCSGAKRDSRRPARRARPSRFADAGHHDPPDGRGSTPRRYGAAATAGRTGSCPSPRTRTPTRCRWRSATAAWTSSPTPGTYCYHGEPRVAVLLPVDDRAQHRRDRRAQPVRGGRPVHVAAAGADVGDRRPSDPDLHWTAEHDGY